MYITWVPVIHNAYNILISFQTFNEFSKSQSIYQGILDNEGL
jgi:hypothetical protein